MLSDTEGRSQGIVHLEHGEDTNQVDGRGGGAGGAGRFAWDARSHSSARPVPRGYQARLEGGFRHPTPRRLRETPVLGPAAVRYGIQVAVPV